METLELIGTVIPPNTQRDAVHIAVYPMLADRELKPGQRLEYGIVDPYLQTNVQPGNTFFLFLYPATVQSIRHLWSHPGFPEEKVSTADVGASVKWLTNIAAKLGQFSYRDLIEATEWAMSRENNYRGDSICFGNDLDNYSLEPNDEFWHHYQIATGRIIAKNARPTYFRCAC